MPIQVVTLATGPSACLDSRTRPDLADAGSLCGPGNCSGSARDERDDRAGERPLWTEGSAVCPVRLHASSTVTGRGFKIQGLLALDLAGRDPLLGGIHRPYEGAPQARC